MKLSVEQVQSAVSRSSHSEFYLDGSGLNKYLLTDELNKIIERLEIEQNKRGK